MGKDNDAELTERTTLIAVTLWDPDPARAINRMAGCWDMDMGPMGCVTVLDFGNDPGALLDRVSEEMDGAEGRDGTGLFDPKDVALLQSVAAELCGNEPMPSPCPDINGHG